MVYKDKIFILCIRIWVAKIESIRFLYNYKSKKKSVSKKYR